MYKNSDLFFFSDIQKHPSVIEGCLEPYYSTVTDFAKLRGLSTSQSRCNAA